MKGGKYLAQHNDFFLQYVKWNQYCVVSQSLNNTEKRYRELQMKVDSLGGESGGLDSINKKAMDIKKEAEDLLNKASKGIEQLRSEYTKLLLVLTMCSLSGLPTVQFRKNKNRD